MLEYLVITRTFVVALNLYAIAINKEDLFFRRLLLTFWSIVFAELLVVSSILEIRGYKDISDELETYTGLSWIRENIKY